MNHADSDAEIKMIRKGMACIFYGRLCLFVHELDKIIIRCMRKGRISKYCLLYTSRCV